MRIEFFTSAINNANELKIAYRELALANHPDINKNDNATEKMQKINAEYEYLFNMIEQGLTPATAKQHAYYNHSVNDAFRDIINALIVADMQGVKVELIGSWLWASGQTLPHREVFKMLGFGWSGKSQTWIFKNGCKAQSKGRGKYGLEGSRAIHGTKEINLKADRMPELTSKD